MSDDYLRQLTQAKERFNLESADGPDNFQSARKKYDQVLERTLEVALPPELEADREGIYYHTPNVEKALHDYIDVLVMNPTAFDVIPLAHDNKSIETGREILLWTARGWEYENEGRWWDEAVAEGQIRYGLKCMQYLWHSGKSKAHKRWPFYWRDCDNYSIYWIGDERTPEGPDLFVYEYELPYIEARDRYARDNDGKSEKFVLDRNNKIAWVGEDEAVDQGNGLTKKVRIIVMDHRKLDGSMCPMEECDHPQRVIRTFVCGPNENDKNLSDLNLVEEVDSPFPGCSFFVTAGRSTSSSDPNLRFRPMLHPLYVESYYLNYVSTLLLTGMRRDYSNRDLYVNTAGADPLWIEDKSQQEIEFGEPQEDKIYWFPGKIERVPRLLSPHLPTYHNDTLERMREYMPNRFLTGNATVEASNATGSAFLSQLQQAALPFDRLLSKSDKTILRSRQYSYHAVKYWGMAKPDLEYPIVMTGEQECVVTKGEKPKRGERIVITAEKLNLNFDLLLRTRSETHAEEQAKYLTVKDQVENGYLTPEMAFRALDVDDVEGHVEQLEEAWQRSILAPFEQSLVQEMVLRYFYGATGVDINQMIQQRMATMQQAQQPQQGQPQSQGAPQPNQQAGSTYGVPGNNMQGRGPTINLPPLERPSGGSSSVRPGP